MHDVHRRARHLGQGDGAMHGFGFGRGGTRERVIDGRGLALGQRALDDHVDHAAVFGMHADQRAVLGGLRERFEDGGVIHHQDARIGHEQLEAGHAFAHHVVHVFEAGFAQIGDDHVQAVVDGGAAFGLLPPGVERVAHARAAGLDGEIDQRGGAAEGRGARAGFEIVARSGAAEGHVEMRVGVDAAGQQQHAGGVDHAVGRASRGMPGRISLIFSPSIRMSAGKVVSAVTTVPLRISVLISTGLPFQRRMRCSQDSDGLPVSTCSMVMQSSTGQTSAQRLQPTHSSSSTRGNARGRSSITLRTVAVRAVELGNRRHRDAAAAFGFHLRGRAMPLAIRALRDPDGCTGARHPSRRCSRGRSRCISPGWMRATIL